MIRQAFGCVVVFGCLMASASLHAHHSTAGVYDPGKEVTVKGALTKLQFVNPHGSIVVAVHLDPRIARGCIAIPTGGGHAGYGRYARGIGVEQNQGHTGETRREAKRQRRRAAQCSRSV